MPRDRNIPQIDPGDQPLLENLARMISELLERRLGPNATFEDRQRARMGVMTDVMWLGEEHDLVDLVEDAPMITIGGRPFRRLSQPSSKIYSGVWGAHRIDEPLYRDASVHAGETVKPLDLRVGAIATSLLPDAARILGYLMAHGTSREVVETLATMGMRPPSRALIERRVHELADEVVDRIDELDAVARDVEAAAPLPVAAVSVGLDRFSVRMSEALPEGRERPPRARTKPYQRTPPPPRDLNWRMAWVGSVTLYDADGEAHGFSEVPQFYCSCSPLSPPLAGKSCDQLDADRFCALLTGNPDAKADSFFWNTVAVLDAPGFCCLDFFPELSLGAFPEFGIDELCYSAESMAESHPQFGSVIPRNDIKCILP